MYPVQVVVLAVVGLFFSALLLALVLWLISLSLPPAFVDIAQVFAMA